MNGLFILVAGCVAIPLFFILARMLSAWRNKISQEEVFCLMTKVLSGNVSDEEWDDFTCIPIKHDKSIEEVRKKCVFLEIKENIDGAQRGFLFNSAGLEKIRDLRDDLKK